MPYQIRNGDEIWHEKGGKWSMKQKCSSAKNAKEAMRLLQGIEHGWKPTMTNMLKRRMDNA